MQTSTFAINSKRDIVYKNLKGKYNLYRNTFLSISLKGEWHRMREDYKKMRGKIVHGTTPEERFKEVYGITIEEWQDKGKEKLEAQIGMSSDEWYIKQVNSLTPIHYFKSRNGAVSEDDVELVKDLQELGLNDGVINVLLDYVGMVSRIGCIHSLARVMGEGWLHENILTTESAIAFVREKWNN